MRWAATVPGLLALFFALGIGPDASAGTRDAELEDAVPPAQVDLFAGDSLGTALFRRQLGSPHSRRGRRAAPSPSTSPPASKSPPAFKSAPGPELASER